MRIELSNAGVGALTPVQGAQLAGSLAAHPFLSGLSPEQIATLAEYATGTDFVANQWVFREGDLANRFYLIQDGCIALAAALPGGGTRLIDRIGPGDVLGWSWMFPPFRWHFSARAFLATKAIFVYGTWLLDAFEADKALGYELTKRIAMVAIGRLQAARSQLASLASRERDA